MNNLNNNENINILDLPHEMLLAIFNKMNIIDVLYSLVDINQEFDQLILDPLYIRDLNMTRKSLFDNISPIESQILDRICEKILPRINDQVNKLTVESLSIERILYTVEYPQLHSLSLVNFQEEVMLRQLTGIVISLAKCDTILRRLLTDQITSLNVQLDDELTSVRNESNMFALIISMCKRLNDLTFSQWFTDGNVAISTVLSTSCASSTLTKLNIYVNTFDDCLYLLDGRFECLSTLIINIIKISEASSNIDNTKKLPKLKCFSFKSYCHTLFYDSRIIPLLCRMSNLEELILFLSVTRINSTYIDGTHLHNEILDHMPRLNNFTFSISTIVYNTNAEIDLPSNDEIQRSFIERGKQQVGSYVKNDPSKIKGECRVYSIPYQFDTFLHLTSDFPGGRFDKVQWLLMADRHPFEHELFNIISQDFPFLRKLTILNPVAQQKKQHSFTFITFTHLVELHFNLTHIDYVEQFLFERNTHVPRLLSLEIEYETLAVVTNNFTSDAARLTCAQLQRLVIKEPFVRPEKFHSYFPLL